MTLESIAKMVDEKTGIGESNATMAVRIVLEQVKGKLPTMAQGYVDQILQGESSGESSASDVASGLLGKVLGG